MPEPVNFNDRVFIAGKTRSGKSMLAQRFFDGMTGCRRFVYDVKGRLELGVEPTRDVRAIDPEAPVVHYIPARLDRSEHEAVYEAIWKLGPPTWVWTDEGMAVASDTWQPMYFNLIQQQGGELGIGHMVCAQRIKKVAPSARTEADHVMLFVPPLNRLDLDSAADEIGTSSDDLASRMRELQARCGLHSFVWWCRASDELIPVAPIPLD